MSALLSGDAARGRRVSALFARYGEAFTLIRAGTNLSRSGLFAPMDGPTAGTYFDANESVGCCVPRCRCTRTARLPVTRPGPTRLSRAMCSSATGGCGRSARRSSFAWATRRC